MKPTDTPISKFILVRDSTCFGQFLCPSSGVFHCVFGTGTCYTGFTTACLKDQDGTEFHPDSTSKKFVTTHGHMNVKISL